MEENEKLKRTLKHLYENQEFNTTFEDEVYSWNDEDYNNIEEYSFTYTFRVKKVLGEGDRSIAQLDLIITDFQRDGDDMMYSWAEDDFNDGIWYIQHLEELVLEELASNFPISFYLNIYPFEEYED